MDTKTGTLAEFLLERIGEDEAAAKAATGSDPLLVVRAGAQADALKAKEEDSEGWPALIWAADRLSDDVARLLPRSLHDPARVLAECETKRRIVGLHPAEPSWQGDRFLPACPTCDVLHSCPMLRALAAVYSDHADYRPEWRP